MILDTNIFIAYFDNEPIVVETLHDLFQSGTALFLPAVVHTEVLSFAKLTEREVTITEKFLLNNFGFIHIDVRISRLAAHIRRETHIKTPDAYIAATSLICNTSLLTRNVKDFKNIAGLSLQTI